MTATVRSRARRLVAVAAGAVLLAGAACGDDSGSTAGPSVRSDGTVEVREAFSAGGTTMLAVYLDVDNEGPADAIVGATVAGAGFDGAEQVSLHRSEHVGDRVTMAPTERFDLPAGTEGALGPAQGHVMVEGVTAQFRPGDTFTVTLTLASGGQRTVDVAVLTPDEVIGRQVGDGPSSGENDGTNEHSGH